MTKKIEIRNVNYPANLKNVENWKISEEDKKVVHEFFKEYELGKITNSVPTDHTLAGNLNLIRISFEFFNKSLRKLTEKDIDNFSGALLKDKINSKYGRPFSESAKKQIRQQLNHFLKWYLKDKAVNLSKSLMVRVSIKKKNPDFLTEDEIDLLYKNCKNNAERYLIAMLFSSGARASEFFNIRKSDITLPKGDNNFVQLVLRPEFSKTKGRTISLYYKHALEAVAEFLNDRVKEGIHPEDPVWTKGPPATVKLLERFGRHKKQITKEEVFKVINKRLHFHLFRHSCATWLAPKLNRQELCYFFGWRFSSPMPDVYIAREGMQMKNVDKVIINTELGELKTKLSKEEFERKKLDEDMEKLNKRIKQMEFLLESREKLDPLLSKLLKNPKLMKMVS